VVAGARLLGGDSACLEVLSLFELTASSSALVSLRVRFCSFCAQFVLRQYFFCCALWPP
jgi:hypothetical protein